MKCLVAINADVFDGSNADGRKSEISYPGLTLAFDHNHLNANH